MVSNYGFSAEFEAFARAHPYPADSGSTTTRSAASGVTVHVADVSPTIRKAILPANISNWRPPNNYRCSS